MVTRAGLAIFMRYARISLVHAVGALVRRELWLEGHAETALFIVPTKLYTHAAPGADGANARAPSNWSSSDELAASAPLKCKCSS
jgi:hypothetical protein